MNFYESPPDFLEIDNKKYYIDTDFRIWIKFFKILIQNNNEDEKTANLIFFIQEMGLPFSKNTLNAILNFFKGGEIDRHTIRTKECIYDFETDSSLIFSAFLTQYNKDLTTEKIHWWKFKSLFSGLDDNHMISKVMWARNADTKGMSKEMRKYVKSLKDAYPLNYNSIPNITLEERNRKMIDYVRERFKEAQKSSMPILPSKE